MHGDKKSLWERLFRPLSVASSVVCLVDYLLRLAALLFLILVVAHRCRQPPEASKTPDPQPGAYGEKR